MQGAQPRLIRSLEKALDKKVWSLPFKITSYLKSISLGPEKKHLRLNSKTQGYVHSLLKSLMSPLGVIFMANIKRTYSKEFSCALAVDFGCF